MDETAKQVAGIIREINRAWLDGRVDDMAGFLHPDIVMVFPQFAEGMRGRDAFLAGFRDFCENAKVLEYSQDGERIDIITDVAVGTFQYKIDRKSVV